MKYVDSVIVMAAGMGVRLSPIADNVPKALVYCAGRPLIDYTLEFARHLLAPGGNIVVVAGSHSPKLRAYLQEYAKDVWTVDNPEFHAGNILSLRAGLDASSGGDIVLMNVDHIYPFVFAERLLQTSGPVVIAVDQDRTLGPDDMRVMLDDCGRVKAISKGLDVYHYGYIGMTLVRGEARAQYARGVQRVLERKGKKAVAEDVVQELVDNGFAIALCDLSGQSWLEIDTLDDLVEAEAALYGDEEFLTKGHGDARS